MRKLFACMLNEFAGQQPLSNRLACLRQVDL